MEFKDREAVVNAPGLLSNLGLDEALQEAFVGMRRVRAESKGSDMEAFAKVLAESGSEARAATSAVFRTKVPSALTNIYSPFPGIDMLGRGETSMSKQDLASAFAGLEGALEFTLNTGCIGATFTHAIDLGDSLVTVDYDGRINRREDGFEYVERKRSLSTTLFVGEKSFDIQDTLVVRFSEQ